MFIKRVARTGLREREENICDRETHQSKSAQRRIRTTLRHGYGHDIALLRVNLTSNPVTDSGLTIKLRSPLAPLNKGGTGIFSFVPLLKGDLGGSRLG